MNPANACTTWPSAVRRLVNTGALALLLAGCAATPASGDGATRTELAGTAWQLVSYGPVGADASAASAAGLQPARPDQYQLRFGAEGRLSARIDCNRGSGTWSAVPADASSGSLALGRLATTRMMCPPEPLTGRLSADIEAVRSYRIVEGRLQLALPGGVYIWERMSEPDAGAGTGEPRP